MSASTLLEVLWPFTTPLYGGSAPSAAGLMIGWDVAVNGRPYLLDLDPQQQFYGLHFNNSAIQALRSQADQGVHAGEATLTRDDFWRRSFFSFHHGAGQRWTDRSTSDEFRFRTSKGVDVWTHDRVTLLKDVTQVVSSATVNEIASTSTPTGVPPRAYIVYDDNGVPTLLTLDSSDAAVGASTGACTGFVGTVTHTITELTQLATDGAFYYVVSNAGLGTAAIYRGTVGNKAVASFATTAVSTYCVGYAHGHLLAGGGNGGQSLYDCTAGGAGTLIAALTTANEQWGGFTEGTAFIYGWTRPYFGQQAVIYSISYDPTTSTLAVPKIAAKIPVGEDIYTIKGYLGLVLIGTSKGFRIGREGTAGALTMGTLVPIPGGVKNFAPNGQYVFFTWSNFDATSTGIGRIDISVFTDADLVPAYASDSMAPVVGTAVGAVTVNSTGTPRPCFAVNGAGAGIYLQHQTNLVASGTLDTGLAGYGIVDSKDAAYVDVRHEPLVGSVAAALATDEGAFSTVDVSNVQGSPGYLMKIGHKPASRHELRFTLTQQTATTGPALTQAALQIYPAVQRGDVWTVPILIADDPKLLNQAVGHYDFWAEYTYFKGLAAARTPSTFQVGTQTYTVYVDDYKVGQLRRADNAPGGWWGSIIVSLKNLERVVAQ